ncbi:unnamed protein product [Staurois parvus]|uniref:Uncharacterized protein n=1 Tax=Staurois parvus TaxID=386267 RepID=A0ABN9BWE9_9NEOB|nr:unnamed protein product [Staurois parvus]
MMGQYSSQRWQRWGTISPNDTNQWGTIPPYDANDGALFLPMMPTMRHNFSQ